MQLTRALIQSLKDLQRAGISEIPQSSFPQSVLQQLQERADDRHTKPADAVSTESPILTPTPEIHSQPDPVKHSTMNREERTQCLAEIAGRVSQCTRCEELASTRTQTVFGVGNPEATVMFIGEAPGADEDKQGEPFVGRAGKLLDKIIEACGWKREEIYICNILRCRPPNNRNPTPIEADNCKEYLLGQIDTVDPEYIVCWGTIAAQQLLETKTPIGRMRGQFFEFKGTKVLCTYHPSYLLRNPSAKKLVWEDLKVLLNDMGIDPDKN